MKKALTVVLMLAIISIAAFAGGGQAQGGDKPVTISIWTGYPEMEPSFKHAAEAYTKLHPNVKIETLSNQLREMEQKIAVSMASDTAGDIVETSF